LKKKGQRKGSKPIYPRPGVEMRTGKMRALNGTPERPCAEEEKEHFTRFNQRKTPAVYKGRDVRMGSEKGPLKKRGRTVLVKTREGGEEERKSQKLPRNHKNTRKPTEGSDGGGPRREMKLFLGYKSISKERTRKSKEKRGGGSGKSKGTMGEGET